MPSFHSSLIDKCEKTLGWTILSGFCGSNRFVKFLSPYQFNPFDYNPLKSLLEDSSLMRENAIRAFYEPADR